MLNNSGIIAEQEINITERKREYIKIEKYVIMPNHIHMIIYIHNDISEIAVHEQFSKPTKQSVPTIIRSYKSAVTKRINELKGNSTPCPYDVWQSRFYDHIIRNMQDYNRIWEYINTNPQRWKEDCFYN